MRTSLLTGAAILAVATASHASIIPILTSITPDGGGIYTYTYDGQLAGDQGLVSGDKLDIYNVAGYVASSASTPYGDVTASSTTGADGLALPPGFTLNPADTTVVFTYTGAPYNVSGGPYGFTDFTLSFESTYAGSVEGGFSAVAVKNDGPDQGTATYNQGFVEVPGPVPEPATWALMIIGVGLTGGVLRRRPIAAT